MQITLAVILDIFEIKIAHDREGQRGFLHCLRRMVNETTSVSLERFSLD